MGKTNGKTDVQVRDLDLEHELPAAAESGEPENPGAVTEPAAPARGLEAELDRLKGERDALLDRLARLQAEFENARKRAAKEQQDYRDYAVIDLVRALLPTLDSFERALGMPSGDSAEFRSGIELIHKQLHDVLVRLGLRSIPAQGEPFDPNLHQAITMVDTSEAEDNHVVEELQRGYKFKDRLLRPSMVKVARNRKA